ncbi:MAG: hypothetical protein V3R98_08740, partial [Alphaproteobacteria bacterium]
MDLRVVVRCQSGLSRWFGVALTAAAEQVAPGGARGESLAVETNEPREGAGRRQVRHSVEQPVR